MWIEGTTPEISDFLIASVLLMFSEPEQRPLSKRQQKKALKSLEFAKFKEERNLKRKERRRAKRLEGSNNSKASLPIKNALPSGHIIIDCSYEALMNEKEIQSLCAQIGRCYAMNRRADMPFEVELQKFGPKLSQTMRGLNPDYLTWKNIAFRDNQELDASNIERKVVYLTSDSANLLESIERDTAYIIGGLVDRNRHKVLTSMFINRVFVKIWPSSTVLRLPVFP